LLIDAASIANQGILFLKLIFLPAQENEPKEGAVSRFSLRVGTPPAFAGVRQADALFPSAPPMLGAGQRE
jgi:hypothetical protein